MLHSMAIRLIHVHQLETFYLYYGVKYQSGVNFRRQTTPSPMAKCLVILPVTGRILYLTRFFFFLLSFFLSSGNTSETYSFRHALTDFNQTWSQEPLTHGIYVIGPEWGQRSRRGHRGHKGQKLKNATPPTDYRVRSRDSCI